MLPRVIFIVIILALVASAVILGARLLGYDIHLIHLRASKSAREPNLKRRFQLALTFIINCIAIFVLSLGPAIWLHLYFSPSSRIPIYTDTMEFCYCEITLTCHRRSRVLGSIVRWYYDLWYPPTD